MQRGRGLGSRPIFKKFNEPYALSQMVLNNGAWGSLNGTRPHPSISPRTFFGVSTPAPHLSQCTTTHIVNLTKGSEGTDCNTLKHTATHCNTLHHTALQHTKTHLVDLIKGSEGCPRSHLHWHQYSTVSSMVMFYSK